ncbi:MAG: thioredoxin-like domain-containing protein [Bacteroidota bacterium]
MSSRISIIASVIFLLFSGGCRNKSTTVSDTYTEKTVRLKGVLEGGEGEMVILEEMGAREFIPLDTVLCEGSGAFEITISPDEVAFYVLRYSPSGYVTLLIEPGETIEFSGSYHSIESYSIKGSKGSELILKLSLEHKEILNALGEITRRNMELVSSPDYSTLKPQFDRQFDSITNEFYQYSLQFIHENSSSLAILIALYNLYGQGLPVFYPEKDLHVYQFVDSALMSLYSGFEAVDLLNAQVKEAERALSGEEQAKEFQKGDIPPDFVSSRIDGSQLALSDLKGNYVLLSFWAGWSRMSRDENSTLKRAQVMFGEQPFRILQVSFDDNREIWLGAIKEDGLDWDHVSELSRWETPLADLYHVEKIPSNLLLDPSGRIVETDLFGERLLEKLTIIFSE